MIFLIQSDVLAEDSIDKASNDRTYNRSVTESPVQYDKSYCRLDCSYERYYVRKIEHNIQANYFLKLEKGKKKKTFSET